jgi:hypothetical protein
VNEKIDGSDSTLNDIFFGFDGEALKSNAEKKSEEFYKTIEHMFYVQGWEDCEPSFSADNSGYQVGSDGFIHGEHYVYKYFRDDTTWFLDAYDSVGAEAPVEGQSKIFGYSEYHQQYLDILGQSNAYYRVSTQLIFALVANHVVSAVDAFITARGHNDRLLGKQSVWQKVGLDQHLAYNPSEGIQTSIGLRYRF